MTTLLLLMTISCLLFHLLIQKISEATRVDLVIRADITYLLCVITLVMPGLDPDQSASTGAV